MIVSRVEMCLQEVIIEEQKEFKKNLLSRNKLCTDNI